MLKFTKVFAAGVMVMALSVNGVCAQKIDNQPKFLILKIAEQSQQIVAENNSAQDGGMWDSTKEVSSDVWDGTKEVSSDVWYGAKKVTGDVWDGAKEVGSDVKEGLGGDDKSTSDADKNDKNKK